MAKYKFQVGDLAIVRFPTDIQDPLYPTASPYVIEDFQNELVVIYKLPEFPNSKYPLYKAYKLGLKPAMNTIYGFIDVELHKPLPIKVLEKAKKYLNVSI